MGNLWVVQSTSRWNSVTYVSGDWFQAKKHQSILLFLGMFVHLIDNDGCLHDALDVLRDSFLQWLCGVFDIFISQGIDNFGSRLINAYNISSVCKQALILPLQFIIPIQTPFTPNTTTITSSCAWRSESKQDGTKPTTHEQNVTYLHYKNNNHLVSTNPVTLQQSDIIVCRLPTTFVVGIL